jgi:shikimate dehydrogenase
MTYGLIGFPLGHSFSPGYFAAKFERLAIDASYEAFPLETIDAFPGLLREKSPRGLNVTTPYKQAVIPFLDALSEDSAAIGAVNCIDIRNGKLIGHNTDWSAFRDCLKPLLASHHRQALVLGNGGASLAVRYALQQLQLPFKTVSATPGKADFLYDELDADTMHAHPVIINTTVLGTLGDGIPKLPYNAIGRRHILFDLVYNPPLTPFLDEGRKRGAIIRNGHEMLCLQAEASWEIWKAKEE